MIRDEIRFSFLLLFFFVTFRMNIKYLSRSISMRIKDCRYRVVCSRSEEILRFTNLTTVLRFSLIHQLPIFDDGSLPSSFVSFLNWFLSNHVEPRISLIFTITPFTLVQSLRCTKSTILFLLDDREKYTVFPSRWRNLLIPRFSLLKWSTTRSQD